MAAKRTTRSDKSTKKRMVLFRGIEIGIATGKRSKLSKIVQRELKQRADSRGERK